MNKKTEPEVVDGRRLRSERSKKAILDACGQLTEEGVLVPTAQVISDKAGVPIRSFFRHFPDMESLFIAVDNRLRTEYERIFIEQVSQGTLAERVEHAVNIRAESNEANKNMLRSTKAQLWRYEALQANYARNQKGLRKDFDKRVPELRELDRDTREMIDAVSSYEMWFRLRYHQKLSITKSSKMIKELILNLIEGN